MGRCHRNDVATVVLHRAPPNKNTRLRTAFSGASFRRLILDSVSCGGSRHGSDTTATAIDASTAKPANKKRSDPEKRDNNRSCKGDLGFDKLSELLRLSEDEDQEVQKRKEVGLEEMKAAVRMLQQNEKADVLKGACDVRRLTKDSAEARTNLALLGAIPSLVAMLDSIGDDVAQIAALYALLNLAIANDANKAAIVKAGAIHKMLSLIKSPNPAVAEAIVVNFLGLSALDSNKPIIGSSGAIPYLVNCLQDSDKFHSAQLKEDSLRALYNLSISPLNIPLILETNLAPILFSKLGEMEVSERNLSILSNIVSTSEGRKAVSSVPDSLPILIDVLNWTDSSGCQEKASYILMVLAHKSYGNRQSMIEVGISSSLLELTLLGSALSQKRASRILECLRIDKGKQVSGVFAAVSAPICGSSSSYSNPNHQSGDCSMGEVEMMSEERKAVKQLVQQSLQNNMRRIVKRANLPQDFVPSDHLKSLTASSTSKSLPF